MPRPRPRFRLLLLAAMVAGAAGLGLVDAVPGGGWVAGRLGIAAAGAQQTELCPNVACVDGATGCSWSQGAECFLSSKTECTDRFCR